MLQGIDKYCKVLQSIVKCCQTFFLIISLIFAGCRENVSKKVAIDIKCCKVLQERFYKVVNIARFFYPCATTGQMLHALLVEYKMKGWPGKNCLKNGK